MKRAIRRLIADALRPAQCRDARAAWVRRTGAMWLELHHVLDEFLAEAVERMSEEEFERLCDAEFATVDAIMAQLRAAVDEDKWPREMHVGCI